MNISEMNKRISVIKFSTHGQIVEKNTIKKIWAKVESSKQNVLVTPRTTRVRGISIVVRTNIISYEHFIEFNNHMYCINEIKNIDKFFSSITASEAVFKHCTATRQHSSHKNELNNPVYAPSKVIKFEGAIFDKWQGYTSESAMYVSEEKLILITPKCVQLEINDIVSFDDKKYIVEVTHELDEYRNEYEIYRRDEV